MNHISFYLDGVMMNIVKRQREYQQGYQAFIDGKSKDDNPYQNWMRKSAEFKTIFWNKGFDDAELTENKEVKKYEKTDDRN